MNFKEKVKAEFGISLPISGGMGNSIDNAIVIENQDPMMDCVSIEYEVLKYIGMIRGVEFDLMLQELLFHEEKTIDKLNVKTTKMSGDDAESLEEDFYFDITAFFLAKSDVELKKETEKKLREMKRFVDMMLDETKKKENGDHH